MLTITDLTDEEHVRCFQIEDELVSARTMDASTAKTYAVVCIERARAYALRVATMAIPLYITMWAAQMAAASGKTVIKVHHNYLPWVDALLVVRYGEDVHAWPDSLTEKDVQRARDWKAGADVPASVRV